MKRVKRELKPPQVERDSDYLLRLAGQKAIDDAFPIVAMSDLRAAPTSTPWSTLLDLWTERGFGRTIIEDDGYGQRQLWSFSDEGLAEASRLIARQRRASWGSQVRRNAIPILGLIASVAAAIAAGFSAYFSYLGLPR